MILLAAFLGVLTVSAAGVVIYARRQNSQNCQFYFFRCGQCGQKVRYLASKAGRPGVCPRCGQQCTLPRHSQDVSSALDGDEGEGYALRVGQRLSPPASSPYSSTRRAG